MSFGCVICTEVFNSSDGPENYTLAVRNCGHTFHSMCLKTWLGRSKTCPTCRADIMDSSTYRIHLNLVNNNNNKTSFYETPDLKPKEALEAKDREIVELRRQMIVYKDAASKMRGYFSSAKKCFGHIDVELSVFGSEESIDLSTPPSSAPVQAGGPRQSLDLMPAPQLSRLEHARASVARAAIPAARGRASVAASDDRTVSRIRTQRVPDNRVVFRHTRVVPVPPPGSRSGQPSTSGLSTQPRSSAHWIVTDPSVKFLNFSNFFYV